MRLRDLFLRLRALLTRRRVERELHDELTFHIERETHKQIAAGLSPEDAAARARVRFGSVPLAADGCRDARGTGAVDTLARDVRYAWRAYQRSPLAALTIVATIAIGLAMTTVAFTVYNALFLRVDAVRNPEELFALERLTRPDVPRRPGGNRAWLPFTRREFDLLRRETAVLADAAALLRGVRTRIDGRAMRTTLVSGGFFDMLGTGAALGRTLVPADDDPVSPRHVVVLSHEGWHKLFDGDPHIVGRGLHVNGLPFEVVGVMPKNFRGLSVVPPDLWVALALAEHLDRAGGKGEDLIVGDVIGRLKTGVPADQAEFGLTLWASEHPDIRRTNPGRPNKISLEPSRGTLWPESFKGHIAPIGFAFGLVLLIGCANVANLLLARGISRQREIGIRLSLGASRRRVVRQLLTESLILAFAAAAVGAILSRWLLTGAVHAASTAMPPEMAEQIRIAPLPLDWRVVLFLVAIAVLSTVLFGLAPALWSTRVELVRALKGEIAKAGGPGRARQTLVALQVGAAMLLLISSTVFLRSALATATLSVGVRTSDTLLVPVTNEALRAAMVDQVATHPSVLSIAVAWPGVTGRPALASAQPIGNVSGDVSAVPANEPKPSMAIGYNLTSPGYFDVLGIDILKGRVFTADERAADAGVAVVSEQGARRLWPKEAALGQVLRFAADPPPDPRRPQPTRSPIREYTVIGVVRDIGAELGGGVTVLTNPDVYLPIGPDAPGTSLIVRVHGDPYEARLALLDRLVQLDPALGGVSTMSTGGLAFLVWVAFGVTVVVAGLALGLTASGIFSVLSYTVEQRRNEIGVRVALGATTRQIVRWVLSQAYRPVAVGIMTGAALATALLTAIAKWMPFVLGGVAGIFDPLMYAASVIIVVTASVLAASVPALRATRVDPIATLREE